MIAEIRNLERQKACYNASRVRGDAFISGCMKNRNKDNQILYLQNSSSCKSYFATSIPEEPCTCKERQFGFP
ncbi:hypothetical protein [Clostridium thermosuccinogenes]|uniref:hypothetical protein n=1 Tax=Clostridium thermosuccinogenes TaxID=84032 RepID=UPI001374982A|nr:hypothetical protein [Pseudoclostridium thermosuccinogenes]